MDSGSGPERQNLRLGREDEFSGGHWLKQVLKQISPVWIMFFDQFDFPLSLPILKIFFSCNCFDNFHWTFIIDKAMQVVFF